MDLTAAIEAVCQDIRDAGLRASADPTRLNAPCVWVNLESLEVTALSGGGTATVALHLITADTGTTPATRRLAEMVSRLLGQVTPDMPFEALAVTLPTAASPLPALRTTLTIDVDF